MTLEPVGEAVVAGGFEEEVFHFEPPDGQPIKAPEELPASRRPRLGVDQRAGRTRTAPLGEYWATNGMHGRELFHRSMGDQERIGLERGGTWVTLVASVLSREDLFEIALSLKPAPTEPPRLVDA